MEMIYVEDNICFSLLLDRSCTHCCTAQKCENVINIFPSVTFYKSIAMSGFFCTSHICHFRKRISTHKKRNCEKKYNRKDIFDKFLMQKRAFLQKLDRAYRWYIYFLSKEPKNQQYFMTFLCKFFVSKMSVINKLVTSNK